MIGLITDQILAFLSRFIFPWQDRTRG